MADVDSKITLKLLIDACNNKVIFGEAGKDFVDFMFSLLTLPLGTVNKLLSPPNMVGSIGNLYQSVENLDETYLVANRAKSSLLQPQVSTFDVASPLLLGTERNTLPSTFSPPSPFSSSSRFGHAGSSSPSSTAGARNEKEILGGFIEGVITYMITDNLEVTPMSAISTLTLINRFNLKDAQFEEKVFVIGRREGLALLKASLQSPTALTDVFCS